MIQSTDLAVLSFLSLDVSNSHSGGLTDSARATLIWRPWNLSSYAVCFLRDDNGVYSIWLPPKLWRKETFVGRKLEADSTIACACFSRTKSAVESRMAKKLSVTEALMSLGPSLATEVAGIKLVAKKPAAATAGRNQEDYDLVWDDEEERLFREWLRSKQEGDAAGGAASADWTELENEESYRARMRELQEGEDVVPLNWEDKQEKDFRRNYIEMRKNQLLRANWTEYSEEEGYREHMKQMEQENRNKPIIWDDKEERKCQARYRKKYN